jgi:CRISPR/Cas system endoribonuclease Cas6 (RAMP superfamily)
MERLKINIKLIHDKNLEYQQELDINTRIYSMERLKINLKLMHDKNLEYKQELDINTRIYTMERLKINIKLICIHDSCFQSNF